MRTRIFAPTLAALAALASAGCKHRAAAVRDAAPVAGTHADAATTAADPVAIATAFVSHLARGEDAGAFALLDPPIAATAKVEQLTALWKDRAGDGGALRGITADAYPGAPEQVLVHVALAGGLVEALCNVKQDHIGGYIVKPLYAAPDYVDAGAFVDRRVAVGAGARALPGILSLPKGSGPFPVVILLQGSGPSDLDEWGPHARVMPFRDLAGGIASRGVAVLRYDKPVFGPHVPALGVAPDQVTFEEEYFHSLADALALLAATPEIDGTHVFVLGHSLAGWLIPWIVRDHPTLAGAIIASGNARHFLDLEVEQDQYVMKVNHPDVLPFQLDQLRAIDTAKQKRAHDPALADDTPASQLPYGMSARAVKLMQAYDAPAVIATLDRPFLLLQGGRDYNVTMVDHELWKKALAGKDVTAHAYPDLNHAYLTGKGTATPAELQVGGHVAAAVVVDIAAWIHAHSPPR